MGFAPSLIPISSAEGCIRAIEFCISPCFRSSVQRQITSWSLFQSHCFEPVAAIHSGRRSGIVLQS